MSHDTKKDGIKKSKLPFRCEIACLVIKMNKIQILDIHDNDCHVNDTTSKSIAFTDCSLRKDLDNVIV